MNKILISCLEMQWQEGRMFVQWKVLQLFFVQCLQLIINVQSEAAAETDFCFDAFLEG